MKRTAHLLPRVLAAMACAAVLVYAGFQASQSAATDQAALADSAVASPAGPTAIPRPVAAAPRQEIVDLPDDGQEYHLSIFVHDDWRRRANERYLVAMWDAESRLKSIKAVSHYHVYTPGNPIYQKRFARTVPTLPAVMIQDAAGKVHYKVSGDNLPISAIECGDRVEKLFKNRPYYLLPWRRPKPCPDCPPTPAPDEKPLPVEPDEEIPDTEVNVVLQQIAAEQAAREAAERAKAEEAAMAAKQEDADPWWVMLLACAVAGVGTVVYSIRKEAAGR